jgi:hypothetical protein
MAKKKKDEEQASSGVNKSHFAPQAETDGPPPRPEAVDPAHLKPQEEAPEPEARKVKAVDPAHLKPQA